MIEKNLSSLKEEITAIAHRCGRAAENIQLVAVSKRFPVEVMLEAIKYGHNLFGENYIQEATDKSQYLPQGAELHFIGHLQSNKARLAAEISTMIETVDRAKLGHTLNRHLEKLNKKLDILIQVNIAKEPQKSGIAPEHAESLAAELSRLPMLQLKGLMTMPPLTTTPEEARPHFRNLRLLAEQIRGKGYFHDDSMELSMGMSSDFKVAIEEGATYIRIGTAIFGQRPPR